MNWKQPKVYAVRHKDEATRAASRSGGIFTALSDQVLSNGGVVYGCVLTDEFDAVHIRADNAEERNRMRGSKYIQSKLGDTFRNVKEDLDVRRDVLFSGTSCQVSGLKNTLEKSMITYSVWTLSVTVCQVKKYGTHICVGKRRKITLKLQWWISEIRRILVGMTMWKHFVLKMAGLRAAGCSKNFFMGIRCCGPVATNALISL